MAKRESVYKVQVQVLIPFDVRDFDSVVEAATLVRNIKSGKAFDGIAPFRFAARKTSREIAEAEATDTGQTDIEDAIDNVQDDGSGQSVEDDAALQALGEDDPSSFDPDAAEAVAPIRRTRARSAA